MRAKIIEVISFIAAAAILVACVQIGYVAHRTWSRYQERHTAAKPAAPTTNWVGCPVVSDNDPWTPTEGWLPGIQIGLRSDGVVVWKTNEARRK